MSKLNYFKNKVILITGGTKGLGFELANELSKNGAILYLNGRRENEIERCIKNFNKYNILPAKGNLANEKDIQKIISKIKRKYHHLDILINNAGIYSSKDFIKTNYSEFLDNLKINLLGHIQLTFLATKLMSKNKLSLIINISSGSGKHGGLLPSFDYALSKNALIFMSEILAKELKCHNILINSFVIRFMKTKMYETFKKYYKRRFKKDFKTKLAILDPADVAKKIVKDLKLIIRKKMSGKIINVTS